ncbi:MAG: sugar phosphate isomerase/epimerase [Dehalococcoidia bacterium]|nr:sugar phosphate isomerase/epimerase [Dehalococcoidia bacterium]
MSAAESRPLSLSTMWSQQSRFANLTDFVARAKDLGYTHVELSYIVRESGIEEVRGTGIQVSSLHAPAPLIDLGGRRNFDLNLASLDEEERSAAVVQTIRTLEVAVDFGARAIVVHIGAIEGAAPAANARLRHAVKEAEPLAERDFALRDFIAVRAAGKAAHMAAAHRTVAELAEHARRLGVTLGLETRLHCHEIPNPDEAWALIEGYPPEVVGYWHDVGHAEVQDRLGVVPLRRWLDELGHRCVGAHLHDVDGIVDHRAPGGGTADWEYIARNLPDNAIRTFEINQSIPDDAIAAAIPFLRSKGVI